MGLPKLTVPSTIGSQREGHVCSYIAMKDMVNADNITQDAKMHVMENFTNRSRFVIYVTVDFSVDSDPSSVAISSLYAENTSLSYRPSKAAEYYYLHCLIYI